MHRIGPAPLRPVVHAAPVDRAAKRALDVLLAAVGLALCAPLLLACALAIRLSDGGPALFVQERVGQGGRRFRMYKLRTMVVGAEALQPALPNDATGPVFKMRHDPRVTPVGRVLRRFSLDELPQLVNVLRGEMSLVGPRPPIPAEVDRYEPWHLRRLTVLPGLTGLWQVSGRSDLPFDRGVALDLAYIDGWTLSLDLWLILRTVPVVLKGTGAR